MNIRKMAEAYEELSDQIEGRWRNLIGPGCGWFDSWKISGDDVVVTYERPCNGGLATDRIPLACFEEEDEEKAKAIWK